MTHSITEALGKIRPDLNRSKKFKPLSSDRQSALMGDYRDPDAAPAKEGELSPAEMVVGSEINRLLVQETQERLIQQNQFFRSHALGLSCLLGVALLSIGVMTFAARDHVRAGTAVVQKNVPQTVATKMAPVPSDQSKPAASDQPIPTVAKEVAYASNEKNDPIKGAVRELGEDEIPVLQQPNKSPVGPQTAVLNPVTRAVASTFEQLMAKNKISLIENATVATASTTVAPTGTAGLVDGATIANQPSILAVQDIPLIGAAASSTGDGEVLYEAGTAPPASALGLTAAARKKSSSGNSTDEDNSENGGLRVEGIFWDKSRPLALINDKIVEVGSKVGSAKVVAIAPSEITLEENGKTRVMHP